MRLLIRLLTDVRGLQMQVQAANLSDVSVNQIVNCRHKKTSTSIIWAASAVSKIAASADC